MECLYIHLEGIVDKTKTLDQLFQSNMLRHINDIDTLLRMKAEIDIRIRALSKLEVPVPPPTAKIGEERDE